MVRGCLEIIKNKKNVSDLIHSFLFTPPFGVSMRRLKTKMQQKW